MVTANRDWKSSIQYLTELLHIDNCHADAYFHRGQAYAELNLLDQSLADFSATIHFNPMNAKAFYHRGCLLHKCVVPQFLW